VNNQSVSKVVIDLQETIRRADFKGYDPFDGLNSKLFNLSPFKKSRFFRLAWLQFHKRSPINFRPLCLIPKKRNPKAIALMLLGYLNLHKATQEAQYLQQAKDLADWLLANQCQGWQGACWGYPFPWQARAFYVPYGKPNLIATAYVARALRQLGNYSKQSHYIEAANQAADFTFKHLLITEGNKVYFAYIPGETALIHNANLWAAVVIAAAAKQINNQAQLSTVLAAVDYTLKAQRRDGSWLYGDKPYHQFVDSFHSGYNLEALAELQIILGDQRFQSAIDLGLSFYLQHCFEVTGVPKYYTNNTYPIDAHSAAQAILTLQKLGKTQATKNLKTKIIDYSLSYLYNPKKGLFYYQLMPYYKNKINYLRWVQAWMFYALSSVDE